MFKIRQEQIEAMLMHDEEKFIDFVVKHVKPECPDAANVIQQSQSFIFKGTVDRLETHLKVIPNKLIKS